METCRYRKETVLQYCEDLAERGEYRRGCKRGAHNEWEIPEERAGEERKTPIFLQRVGPGKEGDGRERRHLSTAIQKWGI